MKKLIFVFLAVVLFVLSGCRIGDDPSTPVIRDITGDGHDYKLVLATPNATILSGTTANVIVKLTKTDGTNTTNVRNAEIKFSIEGAPKEATVLPASNITSEIGETFSVFSAVLPEDEESKSYFVIAKYLSIADTVRITVTSKPEDVRGLLTLIADPFVINADGVSASTVTATLVDSNGVVYSGQKINFKTTSGIIKPVQPTTSADGKANISLVSVQRNVQALVTATLESDPKTTASVVVSFSGVSLTLRKDKESIVPDGKDTVTVTALLLDAGQTPIFNEAIIFRALDTNTFKVVSRDSVTNNRGEARIKLFGKGGAGKNFEALAATAAGASDTIFVDYSSKFIKIDTVGFANKYTVSTQETTNITKLKITYLESDKTTLIKDADFSISVDKGGIVHGTTDTLPFVSILKHPTGSFDLTIVNPTFSGDLSIKVSAKKSGEVTGVTQVIYIRSGALYLLTLEATPKAISIGGEESQIIATATDSSGNLCAGDTIFFNLISSPGGAEHISPSFAITDKSGRAIVKLISGSTESSQGGVKIVAKSSSGVKSRDTALVTIANSVAKVALTSDIKNVIKGTATYSLQLATIVQDINGNPVPDGTPVVFSARVIGWGIWMRKPSVSEDGKTYSVGHGYRILQFDDYNFNYIRDNGEGILTGYPLHRGEQIAEFAQDTRFEPGSPFWDINGNGIRDKLVLDNTDNYYYPDPAWGCEYPEPWWTEGEVSPAAPDYKGLSIIESWSGVPIKKWQGNGWTYLNPNQRVFYLDYNKDGSLNVEEPWQNPANTNNPTRKGPKTLDYDIDWNANGKSEPAEKENAVVITRTLTTTGGIVQNTLTYGQDDALRLCIEIWAEVRGVISNSVIFSPLPIVEGDYPYFNPFRGKENLW